MAAAYNNHDPLGQQTSQQQHYLPGSGILHTNAGANLNQFDSNAFAGGAGTGAVPPDGPHRVRRCRTRTYLARILYALMLVLTVGHLVLATLADSAALHHLDLEPFKLGARLGFFILTVVLGMMSLIRGPGHWLPYVLGTVATHWVANPAFGDISTTIVLGIAITYGFKHNNTVRNALNRLTNHVSGSGFVGGAFSGYSYGHHRRNGFVDEEDGVEFINMPLHRHPPDQTPPAIVNHTLAATPSTTAVLGVGGPSAAPAASRA